MVKIMVYKVYVFKFVKIKSIIYFNLYDFHKGINRIGNINGPKDLEKDVKYFIATLNALAQYFTEKNTEKKFKFYVVIHGKVKGVFQTWQKVVDSIKDIYIYLERSK